MKELKIHIKINGNNIATAVNKLGFDESASSTFEIIGILQNVIRIEQDRIFELFQHNNIPRMVT